MSKSVCLPGEVYGYWTVYEEAPTVITLAGWSRKVYCICKCGTTKSVFVTDLRSSDSMSCGCRSRSKHDLNTIIPWHITEGLAKGVITPEQAVKMTNIAYDDAMTIATNPDRNEEERDLNYG